MSTENFIQIAILYDVKALQVWCMIHLLNHIEKILHGETK
ncbi:hypothetical protein UAO_01288 [Enterococcus villorum ATCC 700913]|uniref:Transposase n=1 Tax=Enterococcus villorum ATCC 700913 TaxID=1158604 RepID=A0ABN0KGQ5_9ENTE|nr:hypothetical protein UAO_01288 [Enterococcus villorum ATCC 700913]